MMQMPRRLLSIALIGATLCGCSAGEPNGNAQEPWSGIFADVRSQWSANPGVDLLNGISVPVRAYFESRFLVQYSGSMEFAYSGFIRAVPPNTPTENDDAGTSNRRPNIEHATGSQPMFGNVRFRILSIDATGPNSADVTVCRYIYSLAEREGDGLFTSIVSAGPNADTRGILAMRITLHEYDDDASSPGAQSGPNAGPKNDVFGPWQIKRFLSASNASADEPEWPRMKADIGTCIDHAPDPPARRAFLINDANSRSDFPTRAPDPGWPTD